MMARGRLLAVMVALALGAGAAQAQTAAPQVRTQSGALAGVHDGDVVSYKGIPYAAPPVGALRWRAPQPVKAWSGLRAADKVGPICTQIHNPRDNGVGGPQMSEDCLTLNVFAPAQRSAKPLPVMVWIHGGGFVNGSGTAGLYDGSGLARQGVVAVTINYRLGRFGFFAHPALTAAAAGEPVGNYGLMDMIASLKWVQSNIRAFGGDPAAVTIFGESAGGIAVNDLMVSPMAKGLFIRAIVESGAGRETGPSLASTEKAGQDFAAKLGLSGTATAADLRGLTAEQIIKAGDPDIFGGGGTMVDGKVLTVSAHDGFVRGIEAKVPYIVGYNNLEFPAPPEMVEARLAREPSFTADARAKVAAAYGDRAAFMTNIVSDRTFVEPALEMARLHASHGQPTWLYRFSVLSPLAPATLKGAPHASERQYVFRTLNASTWPTTPNDAVQAAIMSAYWVSFAKTGDPNGGARPQWPTYVSASDQLLEFTNDGPKVVKTPNRAALDAIAATYR
jgi:para-nitrobenzyl esterase